MLKSSRRQISLQVFWQWLSLLAQVILIFAFARIFAQLLETGFNLRPFQSAIITIVIAIVVLMACSLAYDHASFFASSEIKQHLCLAMFENLAD